MIPVTKPFMPPYKEYENYLKGIWEREYLTNNGPLVQELEVRLKEYFDVPNVLYLSNGTIALQIALKALDLKGEIITTPFSYVATTSSIVWEGCKPVFVDINPNTFNINPDLIEQSITGQTTGILATHVFGNPCDIDAIQAIADKHNLKVIYDAAHCFGTEFNGKSVFAYGDISTTSFHATKLFHTIEGGAVFTNNDELNHRMGRMRNFGHAGPAKFDGLGINGKNSELHAAMGLCNLRSITQIIDNRKHQCSLYDQLLESDELQTLQLERKSKWNYSYYPIVFASEEMLLKVKIQLENNDIYPRRYFYPSLDSLDYVQKSDVPNALSVSKRVLCLPLYWLLKDDEIKKISKLILNSLR